MTRTKDNAKALINKEDLRQLLAEDQDLLKIIVEQSVQQILEAEMEEALQAGRSERTETRLGYRAGYYNRTLITRVGKIELRVPQDRQGRFRTEVFERYQRSEKALVAAMLEMYVQGGSTRKVKTITEELCGHDFSSATISRIVQQLDTELEKFAQRRLEESYPYLVLDARYEKVREDGAVRSQAVLVAIGINWEGKRSVLAVELARRESDSVSLAGNETRYCLLMAGGSVLAIVTRNHRSAMSTFDRKPSSRKDTAQFLPVLEVAELLFYKDRMGFVAKFTCKTKRK